MKKKLISIVTPCYNEEANVRILHARVKKVMSNSGHYDYEHIFIDNSSKDHTVPILRDIAANDKNVKVILNARNFGHIRSPYYGLLQANGDAAVLLFSDLQDPPELIPTFIREWEDGYKIVSGVKANSKENLLFFTIRKLYYSVVGRLSEIRLVKNFTGFGLYDREVINILRTIKDPYPYFRGLICEIGFKIRKIPYMQQKRKRGITHNNFYTLYDMAMLGFTSHSKVPLRIATFLGFLLATFNLLIAVVYLVRKLLFWDSFSLGIAPIVIGLFLFFSINLFFLGILGEYLGAVHTQVLDRPLVVEKERINFGKQKK